jgi:ABC-type transport system substrate-binding protein
VQATYRRNPNYWRANRPFFDGIDNHIITEYAQQLAQFTAGKIWNSPITQADLLDTKKQVPALQAMLGDLPLASNRLWFSVRPDSAFVDARVRRAMSMLVDRKLLQDTFYNVPAFEKAGYGVARYVTTIGIVPYYQGLWLNPETSDYSPEQKKTFEYHPDEAKKLLDAAGVKTPVEFNFGTSKGRYGETYDRTVEALKGMFEAQNLFKVNITQVDYTTDFIPKFVFGKGNAPFPFFTPNANFGSAGALKYLFSYFHSGGSLQNVTMAGGTAVPGQDQGDALLEKAQATLDPNAQISILKDWQRYMAMHCISIDDPGPGVTPIVLNWPFMMNAGVWKGNTDVDLVERWIDQKKLKDLGYA